MIFICRLNSATKWLSSTAMRLFSSSTDEINEKEKDKTSISKANIVSANIKRGRGRPRKDPNTPKVKRFIPKWTDIGPRRSADPRRRCALREESGPNDGEARFLLTINALPKNLQIIAKTLHPQPHNKYEEHRLVCRILREEEDNLKLREIFIPTFRKIKISRSRSARNDDAKNHQKAVT